jgi:hypothetical protein
MIFYLILGVIHKIIQNFTDILLNIGGLTQNILIFTDILLNIEYHTQKYTEILVAIYSILRVVYKIIQNFSDILLNIGVYKQNHTNF